MSYALSFQTFARAWALVFGLVVLGVIIDGPADAVEMREAPGPSVAGDAVVTRAEVEIPLRLDNDTAQKVEVTLIVRGVRVSGAAPCTVSSGCTIALYALQASVETKLEPGKEQRFEIPERGSIDFTVKATLPGIGRYVLDYIIGEKDRITPKSLAIRRDHRELPQGSLKIDPTVQLPMDSFGSTAAVPVRLMPTSEGLSLGATLVKADSAGSFTEPLDWPASLSTCTASTTSCAFRLPAWISPGLYRLRVEARGSDIKASGVEADVRVRWPGWIAFAFLFVGGVTGALAASWSRDGRDRLLAAIEAQEVYERYVDFAASVSDTSPKTLTLADARKSWLKNLVEKLRVRSEVVPPADVAKLEPIRNLLPLLARVHALEQRFGYPAGQLQLYDAMLGELAMDTPELAAGRVKLDALATALQQSGGIRPANAPSASPVFVFSWGRGVSSEGLRRLVGRYDFAFAATSLSIATFIGMITLWSNNSTWGSPADWLVALLTGVGLTVGGTIGLQQLAQGYQLGAIERR